MPDRREEARDVTMRRNVKAVERRRTLTTSTPRDRPGRGQTALAAKKSKPTRRTFQKCPTEIGREMVRSDLSSYFMYMPPEVRSLSDDRRRLWRQSFKICSSLWGEGALDKGKIPHSSVRYVLGTVWGNAYSAQTRRNQVVVYVIK